MVSGIAAEGAAAAGRDAPLSLPAQALDHATGWLAAFGALAALRRRAREGGSWVVDVTLAGTAAWLDSLGPGARRPRRARAGSRTALAPMLVETPSPVRPGPPRAATRPHSTASGPTWATPPVPPGTDPPAFTDPEEHLTVTAVTDATDPRPLNLLAITGLTLPDLPEADQRRIVEAAGPGATLQVVGRVRDAVPLAGDVDVIFGVCPEPLLRAAPRLRWVHAIASGVDGFLYPAFRDSDVILTGEKGLVGGHLADHGFGLLLGLTRRIAAALRYGPEGWSHREELRRQEVELEGLTMGIVGFGGTGRAMAKRAAAFGMRCVAMDELGRARLARGGHRRRARHARRRAGDVGRGRHLLPADRRHPPPLRRRRRSAG